MRLAKGGGLIEMRIKMGNNLANADLLKSGLGFCGICTLFIFTPFSCERLSSSSGVIILVSPHQRETLDSSFALIRAHQQCISSGRAGT
ncbi:hypothetical protein CSKR_107109 [Clonorchis sinensis]|uniref:Uncharacterized protein n=1 Tax=Clonorchis sinensis TaxID=79923 RepID=A0A3R7EXZ2_CLOSI|nr:hypothetical protein CSKR_107109 [Clonorchis sinensis]